MFQCVGKRECQVYHNQSKSIFPLVNEPDSLGKFVRQSALYVKNINRD